VKSMNGNRIFLSPPPRHLLYGPAERTPPLFLTNPGIGSSPLTVKWRALGCPVEATLLPLINLSLTPPKMRTISSPTVNTFNGFRVTFSFSIRRKSFPPLGSTRQTASHHLRSPCDLSPVRPSRALFCQGRPSGPEATPGRNKSTAPTLTLKVLNRSLESTNQKVHPPTWEQLATFPLNWDLLYCRTDRLFTYPSSPPPPYLLPPNPVKG